MGTTDEYPVWAQPYLVRRMLWKEYGIAFRNYEFEDVLQAMKLHALETERSQHEQQNT